MKRSGHSGSIDPNYKAGEVVKADKSNPKISPQPKASEWASPEDVRKALARAKRILALSQARLDLLAMPVSPTIH